MKTPLKKMLHTNSTMIVSASVCFFYSFRSLVVISVFFLNQFSDFVDEFSMRLGLFCVNHVDLALKYFVNQRSNTKHGFLLSFATHGNKNTHQFPPSIQVCRNNSLNRINVTVAPNKGSMHFKCIIKIRHCDSIPG